MTRAAEFEAAWTVLQAALPELELPDSTRKLYARALGAMPAGSVLNGVRALVAGEEFNNRRMPTIAELRALCERAAAVASAPKVEPYVGGVPLSEYLRAAAGEDSGQVSKVEAGSMVAQIAARAGAKTKALPAPPRPPVEATDDRLALLRAQAEEITAGEPVAAEEG